MNKSIQIAQNTIIKRNIIKQNTTFGETFGVF